MFWISFQGWRGESVVQQTAFDVERTWAVVRKIFRFQGGTITSIFVSSKYAMRSNPEVYRLHDRALFHFNFLSDLNFWFIVVFVTYNFCPRFRVCILAFGKANGRKHHSVAMILATLFSIQHCCARKHRALLRRHTTHHHKSSFSSARSENAYAERIENQQIEAGSR